MNVRKCSVGLFTVAALAAFASAAQAQSSVTLYGALDAAIMISNKTGAIAGTSNKGTAAVANAALGPSFWGLKGSEDLGGGTTAIFNLMSGIDVSDGGYDSSNGNLFGSTAYVGIENERYGTLKLGNQFSPFFITMMDMDPRHFVNFGSGLVSYGSQVWFTGLANSNAVSYATPKIAGFEGQFMWALGGVAGDFQAGKQYSARLKYENGSFAVAAALYSGNNGGTTTPVPTTFEFTGRTIDVSYTIGSVMIKGGATNYKLATTAFNEATMGHPFNNYVYDLGASWQPTPYLRLDGAAYYTVDRNNTKNHSLMASLGAQYWLSKMTSLYAQVGATNNQGEMDTGLSVWHPLLRGAPGTTVAGNLGIRHTF